MIFTLPPSVVDIPGMLRALADELEAGDLEVDLALVILSSPSTRMPGVRHYGRSASLAEVDGLLLQAAMLPACPG